MADTERAVAPEVVADKKAPSSAEADLTKYKVRLMMI